MEAQISATGCPPGVCVQIPASWREITKGDHWLSPPVGLFLPMLAEDAAQLAGDIIRLSRAQPFDLAALRDGRGLVCPIAEVVHPWVAALKPDVLGMVHAAVCRGFEAFDKAVCKLKQGFAPDDPAWRRHLVARLEQRDRLASLVWVLDASGFCGPGGFDSSSYDKRHRPTLLGMCDLHPETSERLTRALLDSDEAWWAQVLP